MEQTAELYQVVRAQARLETAAFVERFVDLPHAEDGCRGCPNVGQYWTCPPYAFPAAAYWGRFREIELIGQQMHFSDAALAKTYPPEELEELERAVLVRQARLLADEVLPAAPEGRAAARSATAAPARRESPAAVRGRFPTRSSRSAATWAPPSALSGAGSSSGASGRVCPRI